MKKIGQRTREEAIEACLLIADTHFVLGDYFDHDLDPEASEHVDDLMAAAIAAMPPVFEDVWDLYLEAAALLRGDEEHEPWSPGHPVYLRRAS